MVSPRQDSGRSTKCLSAPHAEEDDLGPCAGDGDVVRGPGDREAARVGHGVLLDETRALRRAIIWGEAPDRDIEGHVPAENFPDRRGRRPRCLRVLEIADADEQGTVTDDEMAAVRALG